MMVSVCRIGDALHRSFKGKDGFWLNGKPYEAPLIGANLPSGFCDCG